MGPEGEALLRAAVFDRPSIAIIIGSQTNNNVATFPALLYGWALQENTGTNPAQINIYDSPTQSGLIVAGIAFSAGQSVRDSFGQHPVFLKNGCSTVTAIGQVVGAIWLVPVDW